MEFKFNVTQPEAEMLLNALAQGPFAQVHQLIGKLQNQAQAQQQANQPPQANQPQHTVNVNISTPKGTEVTVEQAAATPTQTQTEEIRHE